MVHSSFVSRDGRIENTGIIWFLLVSGIVMLIDNCFHLICSGKLDGWVMVVDKGVEFFKFLLLHGARS